MRDIPKTRSTVRRPLGFRAEALRTVRKILAGATRLSDLREAERREIMECIEQTIELLVRLDDHRDAVLQILEPKA
jgi:hypothetical protein